MPYRLRLTAGLFLLLAAAPLAAQPGSRPALTAADYDRAARYLGQNLNGLVTGATVLPNWLPDGRFWYASTTATGTDYWLVDPARRTRTAVFDPGRFATALGTAAGATYEATRLPFRTLELNDTGTLVTVAVQSKRFTCDLRTYRCSEAAAAPAGLPFTMTASPDGKRAVFIRTNNLWLRDLATGTETQLTTDGQPEFGYATDNAGWTKSDRAVVVWSPDSRRIATFQHDARGTGAMYLVSTAVGHPTLEAWKYPMPGDSLIFRIERVVIDLGDGPTPTPRVLRLQMPPDQHRSTLCDHIVCGGTWADVDWSEDSRRLFFVSSSRDHKEARLREADLTTGAVREILRETSPTYFESGAGRVNWHVLPASNEVLWFSEKDNWGNLYLHDLTTGALKNRITSGPGAVLQVLKVDEANRVIFFTGGGREAGRDPYFRHFYRVGFDGRGLALLTPENADHTVRLSPDGRSFVDTYSRPEVPPVTVVRDMTGRLLLTLDRADISRLTATGWTPPIPFSVKARDGETDLYGLMFRPTNFDSTRKYPIINSIYPGPQTGSVGGRSFSAARGDTRALAELGFIVIQLDAMGTPGRSKSFHDAYYGNMGDNGLPDQVTAMQQLAARYPWIDLDRAGIYGHSGGGYASTAAILQYPDFFKVAVSQAGNHDNRTYEDDWGEKWQGLLAPSEAGGTSYDNQANQLRVDALKGKLLIAHGTMDNNVPPNNTLMVVNELIRANKDFDLILFPNRRHGFGGEPYMTRRRWDYFVRWLMGAEPPHEYTFAAPQGGPGNRRPGGGPEDADVED